MRYIVRVIDYHYGGHVLYVMLLGDYDDVRGYEFTPDRNKATIFKHPKQLVDIRDKLVNNGRRTVETEQIVDSEALNQLVDI